MNVRLGIACVAASALVLGMATPGISAAASHPVAADHSPHDRTIVLQPDPPEKPTDTSAAKTAAPTPTKAKTPAHPPVSRARLIDNLATESQCRQDTQRAWVTIHGPGDVRVSGWGQCAAHVWTFDAATATGHVGGIPLRPDDVVGHLTITGSKSSGQVRAGLPWKDSILPNGFTNASLLLAPAGARLSGTIAVRDAAKVGQLTMSGNVTVLGNVILDVTGNLQFAGSTIPVTGVYRSGSAGIRGRGDSPTWLVSGTGTSASIAGATFARPRLVLIQSQPGIHGTANLRTAPYDLSAAVTLDVTSGSTWTARVQNSRSGTATDPRVDGLSLVGAQLQGSIAQLNGRSVWALRMPMTVSVEQFAIVGEALIGGPDRVELLPKSGTGDLYGDGTPLYFNRSAGSMVLSGKHVTGQLAVGAQGEQLFHMPEGWSSSSVLVLRQRQLGTSATLTPSMRYVLTQGQSRIVLVGPLPSGNDFHLQAGGSLHIGQTDVPVSGSFGKVGRLPGAPQLLVTADTDDAPNGRADLGSGFSMKDTTFNLSTPSPSSGTTTRSSTMPTVTYQTSGTTVTVNVTSSSGEVVQLAGTIAVEGTNYVVTLAGVGDDVWEPYSGLSIPVASIGGTVTLDSSQNITSFDLHTGTINWEIAEGVTLTTALEIGSECPLDEHCPEDVDTGDLFYVGAQSAITNIPPVGGVTIPTVSSAGAFLSDGSWVRWDATISDPVTIEGPADSTVTMEESDLTIFSGERDDTIAGLGMPDLSALSGLNGVNVQLCGTFKVEILDLNTGDQEGCAGTTKYGAVLGQVHTGGDVSPTDDHNGLFLPTAPSLSGFAWSGIDPSAAGLDTPPVMDLFDQAISLVPDKNSFTADVTIPASLMQSFGTGINSDTAFTAAGWFTTEGEFELDLSIPVNLTASGLHLDSIDVGIAREEVSGKASYDFTLDGSGNVNFSGNHYPLDAMIELKAGTINEAAISLTVIGDQQALNVGTFDDTSLIPQGDFEPPNTTLVDGNFDDSLPANDFTDGGFESSTAPHNLVSDSSFEDSATFNLLNRDVATSDGDTSGNLLANPGFDDTDMLANGDFEGLNGTEGVTNSSNVPGWIPADSNTTLSLIGGDAGPNSDGSQVLLVTNNSSSMSNNTGAYQQINADASGGNSYRLTGYARPDTSSSTSVTVMVNYNGGLTKKQVNLPANVWTPFSMDVNVPSGGNDNHFDIYVQAAGKSKVGIDELTFGNTSAVPGAGQTGVSGTGRTNVVLGFENQYEAPYTKSSGVSRQGSTYGNGYLQTDGDGDWWAFTPGSQGDADGNFDFSTIIYFPGTSGREIADVGFFMQNVNSSSSWQGYAFRLQTSNGDGGFYKISSNKLSRLSGASNAPNATRGQTYRVHLIGTMPYVSVEVSNINDGSILWTERVTLPDSPSHNGVFGQFPDNSTSGGQRWDDIQIMSQTPKSKVLFDYTVAHSGSGYMSLSSTDDQYSYLTDANVAPAAGQTYVYSAWVKSSSNTNFDGNLRILTYDRNNGITAETASATIHATSSWSLVRANLTLTGNHDAIRVGISETTSGSTITPLLIDDQTLQMIPWTPGTSGTSALPSVDVISQSNTQENLLPNPSFESTISGWTAHGTGSIASSSAQALNGTKSAALSRGTNSTSEDYVEYVVPGIAPSTTYTVSSYVWLPAGADPTQLYQSGDLLRAVNTAGSTITAAASPDYSKTGQWQRISTTITTSSTASNLSLRLYAPTGGGWLVDALMVEEGGSLDDYFAPSATLESSDNVLIFTPTDSNSKITSSTAAPDSGCSYSYTARIRSVDGTSFNIKLSIVDGNGTETTQTYPVTGQWTSIGPLTVTSAGGSNPLKIGVKAVSGTGGVYLDDLQLLGTGTRSDQAGALGKLPKPTAWTKFWSGSTVEPVLGRDPAYAHSGTAYFRLNGSGSQYRNVPVVANPGQRLTGTVWIKAPSGMSATSIGVTVTTFNSGNTSLQTTSPTIPTPSGQWVPINFSLAVTTEATSYVQFLIGNSDSTKWVAVDDVSVQLDGMSMVDPWRVSGKVGLAAYSNSATAHAGSDYLQITSSGDGTGSFAVSEKPTTTARSFTAWVRATSGTVAGKLGLTAGSASATTDFTATTTWQQVAVSLSGLTAGTTSTFTSSIRLPSGGTLLVDDLVTRDLTPFVPYGGASAYVKSDAGGASTAPNYLVLTGSGSGKGVKAPTNVTSGTISGGSLYTVTAHVRAPGVTSVSGLSGTVGLDFGSSSGGTPFAFSADDTWQKVTATFTAPSGSFTSFTPKFELSQSGTLAVDTITVAPVKVGTTSWLPNAPSGTTLDWGIYNDPDNAHNDSLGHLSMTKSGSSQAGVYQTVSASPKVGDYYSSSAWVRSPTGQPATLRLEISSEGGAHADSTYTDIAVTNQWQLVQARLQIANSGNTRFKAQFTMLTAGVKVDVDDFTLVRNNWTATDGSTKTNAVGNPSLETDTSGWTTYNNGQLSRTQSTAYTGSSSLELSRKAGSTGDDFVYYTASGLQSNTTYTFSAYVWLPTGASRSQLYNSLMIGATWMGPWIATYVDPDYSKTGVWQRISGQVTTPSDGNYVQLRFYAPTDGGWFVDGVMVQQGTALSEYFEGTIPVTSMSIIGAGGDPYEGSGFARIASAGTSATATSSITTTVPQSQTGEQTLTAFVRTPDAEDVSGTLALSNGCTASQAFTAHAGTDWTRVQATCTLPSSGGTPTVTVTVNGSGHTLDVDSVTFGNVPSDPITSDNILGITTPLDHPETGYRYLWDDAFGVPGLHLWGVTGQVEIINGEPGIGLQATVYQDPTKVPSLLFGTGWIKGDAYVQIDEAQPCLGFSFHGANGTSGISIAKGALKATDFDINIAPLGCAVGNYIVPPGESVDFDAKVGDGTLHFDLAFSKNDEGEPEFSGDLAVTSLNLGGVEFRDLEMSVMSSPTESSTTYIADMALPNGDFYGEFDMSGGANGGVHLHGDVDMTDWSWDSGSSDGLQIDTLGFGLDMDVDQSNCATFSVSADGVGSLAKATNLDFDYLMSLDCGELTRLSLLFDYTHGSITEGMSIDYDSSTNELAGGVEFDFQRKLSWKVIGIRYHRTSRIAVSMDFSMDTTDPTSAEVELAAAIKVASGSGSADCTITGQPSDSCDINVSVNSPIIGTKNFNFSW